MNDATTIARASATRMAKPRAIPRPTTVDCDSPMLINPESVTVSPWIVTMVALQHVNS